MRLFAFHMALIPFGRYESIYFHLLWVNFRPYFWGNFVQHCSFPIFNFSENRVEFFLLNGPSLMSNCLLIILVIGSCVIFGGFPSRFSKCCFHSFILSCWFAAFSFALAVFFLLLTSFIVCQAILDCLSSTESLILSIWFWMYSVLYMYSNRKLSPQWMIVRSCDYNSRS